VSPQLSTIDNRPERASAIQGGAINHRLLFAGPLLLWLQVRERQKWLNPKGIGPSSDINKGGVGGSIAMDYICCQLTGEKLRMGQHYTMICDLGVWKSLVFKIYIKAPR
jgi:hypothetical protein